MPESQFPMISSILVSEVLRVSPPVENLEIHRSNGGKHVVLFDEPGVSPSCILLGKIIELTRGKDLLNANVWMQVSRPKVLLVFGRRGSGKSYDLGILIESLLSTPSRIKLGNYRPPVLVFDPLNQFWTLTEEPSASDAEEANQVDTLREWGLEPQAFPNIRIFVPRGSAVRHPEASEFALTVSDMSVSDWCGLFEVDQYADPVGQLLSAGVRLTAVDGYHAEGLAVDPVQTFGIQHLMTCIRTSDEINDPRVGYAPQTLRAVLARLESLRNDPLFSGKIPLSIRDIFQPGIASIFMLREVPDSVRSVVVSIVLRHLMEARGKRWEAEEILRKLRSRPRVPPSREMTLKVAELGKVSEREGVEAGWVILDEAHTLCPAQGSSSAKDSIIKLAKQGRAMGLSLAAATQQPSALSTGLASQRDVIFLHHLGIKADIDAALAQMNPNFPSSIVFGREEVTANIPNHLVGRLSKGEVILSLDSVSRNFQVRMRPRVSSHGGKEPLFV